MSASAQPGPEHVARVVVFFETLTPQTLEQLALVYAADAHFKDPFNDVRGLPAIRGIFAHMFATLRQPRFVITRQVMQGNDCFLTWDFYFFMDRLGGGGEQKIAGATHLVFNAGGRIALHRDYWDAAEELYEKLPVVGGLMRWLKRRASS